MKLLPAGIRLRPRKPLRFCAWAVLLLTMLASLSFLFHVLNRGIDWTTGFGPNPERTWDRLLWLRR